MPQRHYRGITVTIIPALSCEASKINTSEDEKNRARALVTKSCLHSANHSFFTHSQHLAPAVRFLPFFHDDHEEEKSPYDLLSVNTHPAFLSRLVVF